MKPNILLIMTDQQRYDTIAAMGFDWMNTPNLDKFVREGTSFSNCFVAAPTCVPSRAALFNGIYPDTSGIYKNKDEWQHTWVESLNDAGYYCVNFGKMHTFPLETSAGFHERFVVENKDRFLEDKYFFDRWDMFLRSRGVTKQQRDIYRKRDDYDECLGAFTWDLQEDTHPDNFVGNLAKWWIENKKAEWQPPFFIQVGFPGPHPPFDPVARYIDEYMEKDFPLPDVTDAELEAQPEPLKRILNHTVNVDHDSVRWQHKPSKTQLKKMRAHYYANVTMIDELIGNLLDALDNKGLLDNTIVIFTSDHGDCMGDHGHSQKWNMYDVTTRVPLIFWAKDGHLKNDNIVGLVQNFDVGPTILDLAGVDIPEYYEAQSLIDALKGEKWQGRDVVISMQASDLRLEEADCYKDIKDKMLLQLLNMNIRRRVNTQKMLKDWR